MIRLIYVVYILTSLFLFTLTNSASSLVSTTVKFGCLIDGLQFSNTLAFLMYLSLKKITIYQRYYVFPMHGSTIGIVTTHGLHAFDRCNGM